MDVKVRENQVDLKRREVCVEEIRVERELELKQRELLLRERELSLKEKRLGLKERKSESFQERLSRYEQQQIVLQQQLFSLQQQISHVEKINEDILKLFKTKENQQYSNSSFIVIILSNVCQHYGSDLLILIILRCFI